MANEIFMPPDDTYVVQHKKGELPTVTVSDDGKVLTVIDGSWGAGEGGSSLPEVTNADNGKVLTVINGSWGAGGASGLLITMTSDTDYYVLDKNYTDIKNALLSGIMPVVQSGAEDDCGILYITGYFVDNGVYHVNVGMLVGIVEYLFEGDSATGQLRAEAPK